MNNASLRSSPPSALLHPDTRSHPLSLLHFSLFLTLSFCLSLPRLLPLRASPSPRVAFRNLFVIKAAIYFTLIEKIGRLPLAATIYHDRTGSSSASLFAFSPPQKIIMPRMYVPAQCNCGTFSRFRDFPSFECRTINDSLKFSNAGQEY